MRRRFDSSKVFYRFDPDIPPIGIVKPGEIVEIETRDCFSNQIFDESQLVTSIDFSRVNPATGPIYVESAERGDALAVHIRRIRTSDRGVIVTLPGAGFLGEDVRETRTRICRVLGEWIDFRGVKIPSDLLPALKGRGFSLGRGGLGYIPGSRRVQPCAWSQARYPYPA